MNSLLHEFILWLHEFIATVYEFILCLHESNFSFYEFILSFFDKPKTTYEARNGLCEFNNGITLIRLTVAQRVIVFFIFQKLKYIVRVFANMLETFSVILFQTASMK